MTILYIEDEVSRNAGVVNYFKLIKQWEVLPATTPSEALAKVEEHKSHIDVVLLDIMMPPDESVDAEETDYGRDTGIVLLKKIKPQIPDTPVIILTARRDLKAKDTELAAWVLNKPISPRKLVAAIEQFI